MEKLLMKAIQNKQMDIVKDFLYIDKTTYKNSDTVLTADTFCNYISAAISGDHLEMVKLLSEHYKYNYSELILQSIEDGKSLEIIKYLIDINNDTDYYSCLEIAIIKGNLDLVKHLMSLGKINIKRVDTLCLHTAIVSNCLEIFKYLISNGITIDDKIIRVLLKDMVIEENIEFFKYFLENYHVTERDAQRIYTSAVFRGRLEMIKYMDSKFKEIYPCHFAIKNAIKNWSPAVPKYLMKKGIDIKKICEEYIDRLILQSNDNINRLLISIGILDERINLYKYIDVLDESHLNLISDNNLKRIIRKRKRVYSKSLSDVIFIFQESK